MVREGRCESRRRENVRCGALSAASHPKCEPAHAPHCTPSAAASAPHPKPTSSHAHVHDGGVAAAQHHHPSSSPQRQLQAPLPRQGGVAAGRAAGTGGASRRALARPLQHVCEASALAVLGDHARRVLNHAQKLRRDGKNGVSGKGVRAGGSSRGAGGCLLVAAPRRAAAGAASGASHTWLGLARQSAHPPTCTMFSWRRLPMSAAARCRRPSCSGLRARALE